MSGARHRQLTEALSLTLLLLAPISAKAQWSFDVGSVESYIYDHKQQRALLSARSTLEYSNKLLHDYSQQETTSYKDLNAELDKYTRAFDVIDVMYQSLRTALNAYSTYEGVSEIIGEYKDMLEEFNEKIIKRNRIELADTLILSISARAIQTIAEDGKSLYGSVSDLVLYVTGAAACSTADLLAVLNDVNDSLDGIERHLRRAYFETWKYIQVRIGYWKEKVYRTKTRRELVDDAFGRWRDAGLLNY